MSSSWPVLDPWSDAAEIGSLLSKPSSQLVLVLGAEAWCEKCQSLRPVFDQYVQQAASHVVMLWLDLEEHAEFLGEYIPDSLPELCIYQRGVLISKVPLDGTEQGLHHALIASPVLGAPVGEDPGVFARLVQKDWAQSS